MKAALFLAIFGLFAVRTHGQAIPSGTQDDSTNSLSNALTSDSSYIKVITNFAVDEDGRIVEIKVTDIECAGCDFFTIEMYKRRAVDYVKGMKIAPALNKGKPVKVYYNQPVTFALPPGKH